MQMHMPLLLQHTLPMHHENADVVGAAGAATTSPNASCKSTSCMLLLLQLPLPMHHADAPCVGADTASRASPNASCKCPCCFFLNSLSHSSMQMHLLLVVVQSPNA